MDIEASWLKSLLVILGFVYLSLITYVRFGSSKQNIPFEKISIVTPEPPPIAGFYHFATVNVHWRNILNEQMLLAHASGLVEASTNIYVTGLGKIDENKTIYDIFLNPKFAYEYMNQTNLYEFPTLKKLEAFCLHNNDSLVWYAHSKGASHSTDFVAGWRGIMNYFVLEKWQLCYELLTSTNHTTCGAILTIDTVYPPGWNTYYAGNMWWAKCSHVNRLTRIEKLDQNNRYVAELYVTSAPDIGHFNCFSTSPHTPWDFHKETASCTVNQPLWKVR